MCKSACDEDLRKILNLWLDLSTDCFFFDENLVKFVASFHMFLLGDVDCSLKPGIMNFNSLILTKVKKRKNKEIKNLIRVFYIESDFWQMTNMPPIILKWLKF